MIASGRGGQPGTNTSTGICLFDGPSRVRLSMNTLVVAGHEPIATTAFGPQTCPYTVLIAFTALRVTGPVMHRMSRAAGFLPGARPAARRRSAASGSRRVSMSQPLQLPEFIWNSHGLRRRHMHINRFQSFIATSLKPCNRPGHARSDQQNANSPTIVAWIRKRSGFCLPGRIFGGRRTPPVPRQRQHVRNQREDGRRMKTAASAGCTSMAASYSLQRPRNPIKAARRAWPACRTEIRTRLLDTETPAPTGFPFKFAGRLRPAQAREQQRLGQRLRSCRQERAFQFQAALNEETPSSRNPVLQSSIAPGGA